LADQVELALDDAKCAPAPGADFFGSVACPEVLAGDGSPAWICPFQWVRKRDDAIGRCPQQEAQ
jgi:hypothetical protein